MQSFDPIAKSWEDPVAKFWYRLHSERVDGMIGDYDFLRSLRTNWEAFERIQKIMGYIFAERGLSLFDLVMEACIVKTKNLETQDAEDEQKMQFFRESPGYVHCKFSDPPTAKKKKFQKHSEHRRGIVAFVADGAHPNDRNLHGTRTASAEARAGGGS